MALRIQVVDDSSTIQKVIKIAFAPFQLQVVTSGSYVEALTEIQTKTPDLLIVDANISGQKTLDDIIHLKQESGGAPVLLLRGSYDGINEESFQQAGFEHILRKPFESADIVREAGKLVPLANPENSNEAGGPPPPPAQMPDRNPQPASAPPQKESEYFMDLSDTTGHSVPLPPPIREKVSTGAMDPPPTFAGNDDVTVTRNNPPPPSEQVDTPAAATPPPPPTPSFDQDTPSFTTSSEIDETKISPTPPPGATTFTMDLEKTEAGKIPPIPVSSPPVSEPAAEIPTSNLKGKKAFQSPMEPNVSRTEDLPKTPQSSEVLEEFKGDVADIRLEIARQMREHLPQLVRESVESYCAIHFPKIAREIVTTELRRLADEKARHLIDN